MRRAPRGPVVYPEEQIHEEYQQEYLKSDPHIEEVCEDKQCEDQTKGKRSAGALKQGAHTQSVSCCAKCQALATFQREMSTAEEEDAQCQGEHKSPLEPPPRVATGVVVEENEMMCHG